MSTSETTMYDWHTLPWRKLETGVFKLQTRIYQASRHGETEESTISTHPTRGVC